MIYKYEQSTSIYPNINFLCTDSSVSTWFSFNTIGKNPIHFHNWLACYKQCLFKNVSWKFILCIRNVFRTFFLHFSSDFVLCFSWNLITSGWLFFFSFYSLFYGKIPSSLKCIRLREILHNSRLSVTFISCLKLLFSRAKMKSLTCIKKQINSKKVMHQFLYILWS